MIYYNRYEKIYFSAYYSFTHRVLVLYSQDAISVKYQFKVG